MVVLTALWLLIDLGGYYKLTILWVGVMFSIGLDLKKG